MKQEAMRTVAALCLVLLSVLLLPASAQAQDPQYSDWGPPVNLGPVVNSPWIEGGPAISKDGLSLYFHFSTNLATGIPAHIYVSQRASVNDPWGTPQKLGPNVNSATFHDANPVLSTDGHYLYFMSNRTTGSQGRADIWVSHRQNKRDDFAWEPAQNLGPGINTPDQEQQPCIFEDDDTGTITLFFNSARTTGLGGQDIYASTLQPDGTFGPGQLVAELSSSGEDGGVSIRRDGLEIFFFSDRDGRQNLYVSTRASTSEPWSPPVNLGPVVNGGAYNTQPALSFDGTTLYFTSADRPENVGGQGAFDLWMTTRTKLHTDDVGAAHQ